MVLFLSFKYLVTGELFRFGIPARCIFLLFPALSINSQTGAASTPASYMGSSLQVIIIFLKLSLRLSGVYTVSLLVVPSGLCCKTEVRLHSWAAQIQPVHNLMAIFPLSFLSCTLLRMLWTVSTSSSSILMNHCLSSGCKRILGKCMFVALILNNCLFTNCTRWHRFIQSIINVSDIGDAFPPSSFAHWYKIFIVRSPPFSWASIILVKPKSQKKTRPPPSTGTLTSLFWSNSLLIWAIASIEIIANKRSLFWNKLKSNW